MYQLICQLPNHVSNNVQIDKQQVLYNIILTHEKFINS